MTNGPIKMVRKNNFFGRDTFADILGLSQKIYLGGCLMSKGVILVGYFQQFGIFLGYGQNYLYFFRCSVVSDMYDYWVTE